MDSSAFRGSRGIGSRIFRLFLLLCLPLLLISAPARGEELHTVLLRCAGGGFAGSRNSRPCDAAVLPAPELKDASGQLLTVSALSSLKGFRLESAFLRFRVGSVSGKKMKYALACGDVRSAPRSLKEGIVLWDVTEPLRAWLAGGEDPPELRITGAPVKKNRWIEISEDSLSLQLTFSAEEPLPLFPQDRAEERELLDYALCCLDQEHPVLRHYQEVTGSLVSSRWPLGVPYYFGGVNEEKILRRYYPRQVTGYYRADRKYICGLDCAGFINLALRKSGLEQVSISEVLSAGQGALLLNRRNPRWWSTFLLPGDLVAMRHGRFNHILLYLGTLRTFGWTEQTAGEALPLLDFPLVIHCGENPFYYQRYLAYIREQGFEDTFPPDGGVTVSVVLPDAASAPHREEAPWGDSFAWYLADGYPLLVFSLEGCDELAWHCPALP